MESISSTLNASPFFSKKLLASSRGDHRPHERLVARDDLAHALLDRREILGGERLGTVEVVVEAVLDHRADRHLGVGPQRLHRVGEHMGRVVADELEGARIVAGDELEARVLVDALPRGRPARRRGSSRPCAWRARGRWIWRCRGRKRRARRRALAPSGKVTWIMSLLMLTRRNTIGVSETRLPIDGGGAAGQSLRSCPAEGPDRHDRTRKRSPAASSSKGYVQGVGYRQFARRAALRLGLSGWVRNRADGTVEALISGPPDAVEAMLAELRRGPRWEPRCAASASPRRRGANGRRAPSSVRSSGVSGR